MNKPRIFRFRLTTLILVLVLTTLLAQYFYMKSDSEKMKPEDPSASAAVQPDSKKRSGRMVNGPVKASKSKRASVNGKTVRVIESMDVAPSDSEVEQFAEAADLDPMQVAEMKASYFCDLAISLRERCEKIPRNPEQMEFCLRSMGYYTNSRHCGYQP